MKLLNCYVENFGRLCRQSFDFEAGLQGDCRENGWGKSTLAAFIRIMFYGFEGERRQDELRKERRRYAPWQGGRYGGSLCFEARGRKYLLTRFFAEYQGKRLGKDVFELRDWDSNLPSADFSENIGEELFQIDAQAFARTVFIAQSDAGRMEAVPGLQAALGKTAENIADLGDYERAIELLARKIAELGGRSQTAVLPALREKLTALEDELNHGAALLRQEKELLRKKNEGIRRREVLKKEEEDCRRQKEQAAVEEAKKQAWQEVCELTPEEEGRWQELSSRFPAEPPEQEELELLLANEEEIAFLQKEIERMQLTEAEAMRLAQYEGRFKKGFPAEEEIKAQMDIWHSRSEGIQRQKLLQQDVREQSERAEQSRRRGKRAERGLLLAVALLLAAGFLLLWQPMAAGMCALPAAVLAIIFARERLKNPFRQLEQELLRKQEALAEEERKEMLAEEAQRRFFAERQMPYQPEKLPDILYDWIACRREYTELLKKRQASEEAPIIAELERKQALRADFFDRYGWGKAAGASKGFLLFLVAEREIYCRLRERKRQAEIRAAKPVETGALLEHGEISVMEAESKLRQIEEEQQMLALALAGYERQLTELQEQKERLEAAEIELQELKESYERARKKRDVLQKTRQLLEAARLSFTERYSAPILAAFREYYPLLTGRSAEEYFLDAELNLTVREAGQQRDIAFLSAGDRELIGFCMRLALIKALYPQEKPFLVLDDPFVNWDKARLERGLQFLRRLGGEYQILYFTCHESRLPLWDEDR